MDFINLLAFIQIAVAFDFGLIYLSESHILNNIIISFLSEIKESYEPKLKTARLISERTYRHKELRIRKKRAELIDVVNNIDFILNPENIRWDKYAYTGIFSGVYGLLALLCIGLKGCRYDSHIIDFLLISGEVILLYQFITLIQLSNVKNKSISYVKVLYKMIWLFAVLALSAIMVLLGFYLKFFSGFNAPLVIMVTGIVYFPVIVYATRILIVWCKIKVKISQCEKISEDIQDTCHLF